mmetsp:Transcript_26765/g.85930  ORF Transcript_26765/g.85930 Transcript_26765/m.85930 type:complete len:209 (-) Transcript_26765:518-1144(-)
MSAPICAIPPFSYTAPPKNAAFSLTSKSTRVVAVNAARERGMAAAAVPAGRPTTSVSHLSKWAGLPNLKSVSLVWFERVLPSFMLRRCLVSRKARVRLAMPCFSTISSSIVRVDLVPVQHTTLSTSFIASCTAARSPTLPSMTLTAFGRMSAFERLGSRYEEPALVLLSLSALRTRALTVYPRRSSLRTSTLPIRPVAPTTSTVVYAA